MYNRHTDRSVHCPHVCLYNLWPAPDNGPYPMNVPVHGIIFAEDANEVDPWDPHCIIGMVVELLPAAVPLTIDPPSPPVDVVDEAKEVTMKFDHPPIDVMPNSDMIPMDTVQHYELDDIVDQSVVDDSQVTKKTRADDGDDYDLWRHFMEWIRVYMFV
jgi:hypothetical protein